MSKLLLLLPKDLFVRLFKAVLSFGLYKKHLNSYVSGGKAPHATSELHVERDVKGTTTVILTNCSGVLPTKNPPKPLDVPIT